MKIITRDHAQFNALTPSSNERSVYSRIQTIWETAFSVLNTFFHLFFPTNRLWHTYQAAYSKSRHEYFGQLFYPPAAPSSGNSLSPWISEKASISFSEISEVISNFEGENYTRFIHRTRLQTSTLTTYFKSLDIPSNTDIFMFSEARDQKQLYAIVKRILSSKKNRIAIPLLVDHGPDNLHIVCLFIDKKNKSIQFFDPKGYSYNDAKMNTLSSPDGTRYDNTVKELIAEFIDELKISNITISELGKRCQLDSDQCGLFISHAIKQFSEGNDLEAMVTTSKEMRKFPAEIAHTIIEKYHPSPKS
jgi:hypothetical protein